MSGFVTVPDTLPARTVPAQRRGRAAQPEAYDFRRPLTLPRDHARALEMAFERFGRQFGNQLTARLRAITYLTLDHLNLRTYDEYINRTPTPTAMVMCTVTHTRQTAILQLPVQATMVWIDYLFGGNGRGDDREGRELTDIELSLVKDLLEHSLSDLEYAFSGLASLALTVGGIQYNPQFVQAAAAGDAVLVASFTLRVGEHQHILTLMLPADVMLAKLRATEGPGALSEDERAAAALTAAEIERAMQDVPVELAVRFSPVVVHPRDVIDLAVGDLLPLSHPSTDLLDVVVDGVVLARAAAGSNGSRLACRVVIVEENQA